MTHLQPPALTPGPERNAAVAIVRRLRDAGHVAYLAGGCVRDRLLGLTPKDYDVATDALPQVVRGLFRRSQAVGEAFGVILVYSQGQSPQQPRITTEVATFRSDGEYIDGRRPESVTFTDAKHDAQRRDFTINALFEDPLHDEHPNAEADDDGVIDYVGGRADLQAKQMRAVGDASQRFDEDYLRMLRAVRFAARLGFALADDTAAAIRNSAKHLGQISRERIGQEVMAMLNAPSRGEAAAMLQALGLDGPTLNEEHSDAALMLLNKLDVAAAYPTTLAAWLMDRHGDALLQPDPPQIKRVRVALNMSNDDRDSVARVLRHVAACHDWAGMTVAARKRLASAQEFGEALLLLQAMDADAADRIERDIAALAADGVGLAPPPLLAGQDLIAAGLKPGPRFKQLIDTAYDAQLQGEFADQAAAMVWLQQHI